MRPYSRLHNKVLRAQRTAPLDCAEDCREFRGDLRLIHGTPPGGSMNAPQEFARYDKIALRMRAESTSFDAPTVAVDDPAAAPS